MLLLERGREVTTIGERLDAARAGHGCVVTIEAAAGLGKTRLLTAASERAAADGFATLSARGSELEKQFTFGVARQLYEPLLEPAERGTRLAPAADAVDPVFAVAHTAYWLVAERAADTPLLIAVDDAQWSDRESLRCLAYLARRLADLPVVLLLTVRTGDPTAPDDLLSAISADPAATRITPEPLSKTATRDLIAGAMGTTPDDAFATAAFELTRGNPFFVTSLVSDLRAAGIAPDAEGARALPTAAPDSLTRAVLTRLRGLGPDAESIAQAVAILGDGAALSVAADLMNMDLRAAADAADALARADILTGDATLAYTHPIVRETVTSAIPSGRSGVMHAQAARLLDRMSARAAERVAAQLMHTPPGGDAWIAARLTAAGEDALARGALSGAVAFLRRALEEPPRPDDLARVLHALGGAEVRLGEPGGYEHLDEASVAARNVPSLQASIDFDRARGLLLAGRPEAVDALAQAQEAMPPGERGETIRKEVELIALGRMSPATAPLARARAAALAPIAEKKEPGWEAVLGVLAGNAYLANEPASRVADLARRSLEGRDARGEDPAESAGYLNSCYLLMVAGAFDDAAAHLDYAIECARRANSLIGFAAAASFRAAVALRVGDLSRAEADGRMALDAAAVNLAPLPLPATVGVLVNVMIERGELDEADALIREQGFAGPLLPLGPFNDLAAARGRLRLEQDRPVDALDDLKRAGTAARALGIEAPGPFPWRPLAALAAHAADREDEARALAEDGVRTALAFGAPRDLGIALRASGEIAGGDRGLELLEQAVDCLAGSSAELDLARARTALGAALRRAGRRTQARELLRDGLDGATRCGATALAERTRAELITAGARPRRAAASGIDALTASERRVAELALEGKTNRQIAEALFVTTGTVETHLTATYAKLEISGRRELSTVFRPLPN